MHALITFLFIIQKIQIILLKIHQLLRKIYKFTKTSKHKVEHGSY
jgi:hypothetical protein